MGFFTDLIFELVLGALVIGASILFDQIGRRQWLWLGGFAVIIALMWLRGFDRWSTYAVALGWIGALCWLDQKLANYHQNQSQSESARGSG
jgi:hypothetical protein